MNGRDEHLEIWFQVPGPRRFEFILQSLRPAFESLRKEGDLADCHWDATDLPVEPTQPYRFSLQADAAHPTLVSLQIKERVTASLETAGGSWLPIEKDPDWGDKFLHRMGGPEGVACFEDFQRADCRFIEDIASEVDLPISPSTLQQIALSSIFFHMTCLGIPRQERAGWIRKWIEALARLQAHPDLWMSAFPAEAIKLHQSNAAVRDFLSRLDREHYGWLEPLFSVHEAKLRETAKRLRSLGTSSINKQPLEFNIFHSYIHVHLLKLGLTNQTESVLMLLIAHHLGEK